MAWGSTLWRRVKVFRVALQVFLDYRAARKKAAGLPKEDQNLLWDRIHHRNAERILAAITELEGLWVKFGQYLSTRADVLPEAYISMFRQLQDSLPPRPIAEVTATIEKQLGKPLDELFSEFDRKPLATASIAQVHRARMKDGRDVVVKVQHQGIKECVLQDLYNARVIVEWVAWAEPDYDFGPVLDEWCREVPQELNFNQEAGMDISMHALFFISFNYFYFSSSPENTKKVAHNLKSWTKDGTISIDPVDVLLPEVVQSAEKVLILTYMDGVRINDVAGLDRLGVDKQAAVETITRAYAHQIYIDGFFNADPHPGNFLISTQPPFRPILLDFGLTKSISLPFRQSLAKMLLAAAEGDYSALLSAFSEMGLVLKLDMPEEAMEITNFFFRRSLPAEESVAEMKELVKDNDKRIQRLKSRMDSKETLRTPVSAFPTDSVFFMRVLGLLRGLSSVLGARVVYLEIMKPYAEAVLYSGGRSNGGNELPIFDSPLHSQAEVKLHQLLREMHKQQRILGVQVCAYKDGKVIVDTAAGYLGKYDPRPVRCDSLFPVFSATKGVTAALLHWLADHGKLSLAEKISSIWPEFAENHKDACTVAHALNHTCGLQNALYDVLRKNPLAMCDWSEMLKLIAAAKPESPPGQDQKYHALSFGWICGGIAEKATGKTFQQLIEEAFVTPLKVNGEFYVGIPPGVEERLASLTLDPEELKNIPAASAAALRTHLSTLEVGTTSDGVGPASLEDFLTNGSPLSVSSLPSLFNMLFIRRATIPAANGHFSARALARFYATLASGGRVPPGTSSSKPPLGSHAHRPHLGGSSSTAKRKKGSRITGKNCCKTRSLSSDLSGGQIHFQEEEDAPAKIFTSGDIHDAFVGGGKYSGLVARDSEKFGLGFWKLKTGDTSAGAGKKMAFGHSGIGGSFGYCDPDNDFAVAITVNKMTLGQVSGDIVRLVCSEIGIPCPLAMERPSQ
ncbi:uncharacterized protein LOC9633638 [Selaginella moellendorffii]|uniref:uncharacterized protein LOC9633638 n=1 Tax=Selaginella moellendorffii TaxID=88036 RepID=UPI000D1C9D56|nr:uncharacterized protein LOC9633638 [Selaginella moellendorffii]|eukprot:XP_024525350.1 uncharacterized protein LOC9633638 [Selaginella moellendorffii]